MSDSQQEQPACIYCADQAEAGRIETDNNGPIVDCPVCRPKDPDMEQKREVAALDRLIRWQTVGDGPIGYCAGDKAFGADVEWLLNSHATHLSTIEAQARTIEAAQKEMGIVARQLFLLWSDLQGRAPAEKLRAIETLAKRANDSALALAQPEKADK